MELVFDGDVFVGAFSSRFDLVRAMVRRLGFESDLVARFFITNAHVQCWMSNEAIDLIDDLNGATDETIDTVSPLVDVFWECRAAIEFLLGVTELRVASMIPNYFYTEGPHTDWVSIKDFDAPRLDDDDDMNFVLLGLLRGDFNERMNMLAFAGTRRPVEGNVLARVWSFLG